jgi:hypothetical protein
VSQAVKMASAEVAKAMRRNPKVEVYVMAAVSCRNLPARWGHLPLI